MLSDHFLGNEPFELPIKYDIQENHIRLGGSWDYFYYITTRATLLMLTKVKYERERIDECAHYSDHQCSDSRTRHKHQKEDEYYPEPLH